MPRKITCTILLTLLSLCLPMFALGARTVKAGGIIGDVNGDGKVNVKDFYLMGKAYGSHGSPDQSPNWDPNCDLNVDNVVDVKDFYLMCQHFGEGA